MSLGKYRIKHRRGEVTLGFVMLLLAAACGGGDDSPAAPTPVPPVVNPPAPTPLPTLTTFTIGAADPNFGGQITQGRVTLSTTTVPTGGMSFGLTSSNPTAVPVPSTITLSPGTNFLVPIQTRRVTSTTIVTVTASTSTESSAATLTLTPGTFLSFASSPGDPVASNRSRRYTPANALISATINAALSVLTVNVATTAFGSPSAWRLILEAASGEELRRNNYVNVASIEQNGAGPGMAFRGVGMGGSCTSLLGSFDILDVLYGPGPRVDRLHVEFTQSCSAGTPLQGELYIEP
jgi:hypothetical protein